MKAVAELLQYYQRELATNPEGKKLLDALGICHAETAEHFHLGYASGDAINAMSGEQKQVFTKVGLLSRGREKFTNCLVFPIHDRQGRLCDLCGIRLRSDRKDIVNWQSKPKGLIGISALTVHDSIILTDHPFLALVVRDYGYQNIVSLRSAGEMKDRIKLFEEHHIRRVYLLSRSSRKTIIPLLKRRNIDVVTIKLATNESKPTKEALAVVDDSHEPSPVPDLKMVSRNDSNLHFSSGDTIYRVESLASTGLGMRVQVRAKQNGKVFLDKLDLASAANRQRFARHAAGRLALASEEIERHLDAVAEKVDMLAHEDVSPSSKEEKALCKSEVSEGQSLLKDPDLLSHYLAALDSEICGEDENKRLALLVATSRLLDKPLGALLRGSPSSGKSSLMQAACSLLPASEVLYFSRLTAQALYYMPKEHLAHKLMVIDEYEGVADVEYPLRTMMSSQVLSIAITLRNSGRTPQTQIIEVPARMAVMISGTKTVSSENLSRFIELRMDSSPAQTKRVLLAMTETNNSMDIQNLRNAQQLLKPCKVTIPFAKKLIFETSSVFARRLFSHVLGLVKAHAALSQLRRKQEPLADGNMLIYAQPEDYRAVYGALEGIAGSWEDLLSPAAVELLTATRKKNKTCFTRQDVMDLLGWSYSKTYRTLQELVHLDLLSTGKEEGGTLRSYELCGDPVSLSASLGLPDPQGV